MKSFDAPKQSLGDLDAEAAAAVITAAGDVALILDRDGVVRDVAFGSEELAVEGAHAWIGRQWRDTVTVESRPKVDALLADANLRAPLRWRHLNYAAPRGPDVPVLYSAVPISGDRVVAIGRSLGAIAALQQRLVEAEQSMERDYLRLRHVETRYRLLFQMASEAVLVVDAANQKVVEANPAAGQLLGETARRLVGRTFPEGFDADGTQAIQTLLAGVRSAGWADNVRARLAEGKRDFLVTASLFRQESASFFLVRLAPLQADAAAALVPRRKSGVLKIVESGPDAFVVTDPDGRVLMANAAFLDLAQLATEDQARGESIERWLGRPGVDLNVLIANLRQHGSVRLFATTVRGEYGSTADVEISAVSVLDGDDPCLGFMIRNVDRRLAAEPRASGGLPRSIEQLTELVGRVSLKDIVREATDVIERLCIEAALQLTGDNRASAAELLGLSRQSLYVKLNRYGLRELAPEADKSG